MTGVDPALATSLREGLEALGCDLSAQQQRLLLEYLALIQKWNGVYNLTALRDPREMLTHHLLDSLAVLGPLRRHTGNRAMRVLDVGSGAGLPGVVLAICCPELQVDCVDAVAKKAAFLQQVAVSLRLPNLRGLHARAESLKGSYDLICSRAFASLADFIRLSAPCLRDGGVWMAMKGKAPSAEIDALPPQVGVFHVEPLHVPGLNAERCLVWVEKQQPLT